MTEKQIPDIILRQSFLSKRWKFRYNVVLGRNEFCFSNSNEYRLMTEYDFNSILRLLAEEELTTPATGLKKLLESSFVLKYNPFHDYLNGLDAWDEETDYIDLLASTITTTNDEFWHKTFKVWLIAMVGSLLEDNVINHTFLVFTGKQGVGKTTWLNNLVPATLKNYYFTGAIDPKNKDSLIQLSENMLINIDELQGLKSSDIHALKALITAKEVKIRRPYAVNHESLPHRASFVGSVNSREFLSDVTGNRRFLCFEVLSIEYNHGIPLDKVYAQAASLFRSGFQYWFDKEDVEFLNQNNEDFRIRPMEEELLLKYFDPCTEDDELKQFMTPTEMMNTMAKLADINFDGRNVYRLGKILNQHGYIRLKKKGVYGYYVKPKASSIGYGYVNDGMSSNKLNKEILETTIQNN